MLIYIKYIVKMVGHNHATIADGEKIAVLRKGRASFISF
jgi:hypothetical protein